MTRNEIFFMVMLTGLLVISAVRELSQRHFTMSALLLLIPFAGWLAMAIGRGAP
jgi:hypothetical protein